MKKIILLGVLVILLGLVFALQPTKTISWDRKELSIKLNPNEEVTEVVYATFAEDFSNLKLKVDPDLADVVEVIPERINYVEARDIYEVRLTFKSDDGVSETVAGNLYVEVAGEKQRDFLSIAIK